MAGGLSLTDPWVVHQRRSTQLNRWLEDKIGDAWTLSLQARSIQVTPQGKVDLTDFHLMANYAVRLVSEQGLEAARQKLRQLSPALSSPISGFRGAKILFDDETLRHDLLRIQHPLLPPGSVTPSEVDWLPQHAYDLEMAGAILDLVPELKTEALDVISAVCFVKSPELKTSGQCISTSSKYVPGLIYTSDVPPILLAEALVHEAAHLRLFCHEVESDLYLDSDCTIPTPLRPDLRPPAGLLHQVFVLRRLVPFYKALSETSSSHIRASEKQIRKRLKNIVADFRGGLEALSENRNRYTSTGQTIIDAIVQT